MYHIYKMLGVTKVLWTGFSWTNIPWEAKKYKDKKDAERVAIGVSGTVEEV